MEINQNKGDFMEFKSLKEHQWKEIKKIYMEAIIMVS